MFVPNSADLVSDYTILKYPTNKWYSTGGEGVRVRGEGDAVHVAGGGVNGPQVQGQVEGETNRKGTSLISTLLIKCWHNN